MKKLATILFFSGLSLSMRAQLAVSNDKPVVKELIQHQLTVSNITAELQLLLTNDERRKTLQQDYTELKQKLEAGGNASAKAAASVYRFAVM